MTSTSRAISAAATSKCKLKRDFAGCQAHHNAAGRLIGSLQHRFRSRLEGRYKRSQRAYFHTRSLLLTIREPFQCRAASQRGYRSETSRRSVQPNTLHMATVRGA
jgi:hypothetical protein